MKQRKSMARKLERLELYMPAAEMDTHKDGYYVRYSEAERVIHKLEEKLERAAREIARLKG